MVEVVVGVGVEVVVVVVEVVVGVGVGVEVVVVEVVVVEVVVVEVGVVEVFMIHHVILMIAIVGQSHQGPAFTPVPKRDMAHCQADLRHMVDTNWLSGIRSFCQDADTGEVFRVKDTMPVTHAPMIETPSNAIDKFKPVRI